MNDYVTRVDESPESVAATAWDALLELQTQPTPFMRHAYLRALHTSGCAVPATGWTPRWFTRWHHDRLCAACVVYLKSHSLGEYVFDQGWARAYAQHGLAYYPKAVIAVPFTPVPGSRVLAVNDAERRALLHDVLAWCGDAGVSSLHLLFGSEDDFTACQHAGLMLRHTVQFHWDNAHPEGRRYRDFDDFLGALSQDKRKKIRQERRKVAEAGVSFRWARGDAIRAADWDFFWACYHQTYREHGHAPYLNPAFFRAMARDMADHWLLGVAERDGRPIASSLIALGEGSAGVAGKNPFRDRSLPYFAPCPPPALRAPPLPTQKTVLPVLDQTTSAIAYGRYWGALERVDCLHFETCYYQPLQWCIDHGVQRFEGGAQGEHKLARALLPVRSSSAHWLADARFARAVQDYLDQEGVAVDNYLGVLHQHSPLRKSP